MRFAAVHESAIGTKRTSAVALHMSAFGGKADIKISRRSVFEYEAAKTLSKTQIM
jgi:hypothetical protein